MIRSVLLAAAGLAMASASPLWDYVNAPDDAYSWFPTGFVMNDSAFGWTGTMLNVTSGRWMTPQYSNRYIWSHQLLVVVPDTILDYEHAALYITGGDNGQGNPGTFSEDVLFCDVLASATGTICGVLWQIPNQEITFPSDPYKPPRQRSEDAAVAFTWWDFVVNHPDQPERILYFPMTRAASRAMDAMTEYASAHVPGAKLSKFLVSGASKRGFITWFTAAVDSRVVAAAPIVMDLLNTKPNINHLYQDFGGFSFAFQDYCDMNLTLLLNTPAFDPLATIIDPLTYKENLTMPKLVIDSTGDEFFALDDDHYWWGDLLGETKRLMVANAEHSMATGVIPLITGLDAFWQSIIDGTPRPELTWTIADQTGTIELVTPTLPNQVVMRFSQTLDGKRRDFRLVRGDTPADPCTSPGIPVHIFGDACLVPIIWIGENVGYTQHDAAGYHFNLEMPPPEVGWRGFLAEAYWDGPRNTTFKFTSQVSIVPQTMPYPPCTKCECVLV